MRSPTKRTALAVAVLTAAALGSVALAGPAAAVPVSQTVSFRCVQYEFSASYVPADPQVISVTVDAPLTAQQGDPIPVTYTITGDTPKNGPWALGQVVTTTTPSLVGNPLVGPAVNAVGTGIGPASTPTDLAPYAQAPALTPVTVNVPTTAFTAPAVVNLRVGVLTLNVVAGDDGIAGGSIVCTPVENPATFAAVALTPAPPIEIPVGAIGGLGIAALVAAAGTAVLLGQAIRRRRA